MLYHLGRVLLSFVVFLIFLSAFFFFFMLVIKIFGSTETA
jgi:hypothetical protein